MMTLSPFLRTLFLTGAVLTASATLLAKEFTTWPTPPSPLLPSQDDFYTSAPSNLASYAPGSLLRVRIAPGNLSAMFNASTAHQVVYRTTDSRDQPTWALTTVFSPLSPYRDPECGPASASDQLQGTALLSYQYPYNTVDIDASISVLMHDPALLSGETDITAALTRGLFVSVPDFEGVLAASTSGTLEGHAVLDGVVAVLSLASNTNTNTNSEPRNALNLKLKLDAQHAKFTLWGYSGGSIASEWAAELSSSGYAASIAHRFAGLAIGGMPPDLQPTIDAVAGTAFAGLVPPGLLGQTVQFPESRAWLVSRLKPERADEFIAAQNMSATEAFAAFAGQDIADYFVGGREDLRAPEIQGLLQRQFDMGKHGTPRVPVFAYKSILDEVAPVELSDGLVKKFCADGANILYERNTVGSHLGEFQNGHSRALEWIESVFNGTHDRIYGGVGCVVRNVTVLDSMGPATSL